MGSGRSCVRSSPAGGGRTRVTFLQEDTAGARSLYLSLWSEDRSLVACEINTNPVDTERYRALCDGSSTLSQQIARRFNISALVAPDAPCAHVSSYAPELSGRTWRDGTEGKVRRKRAWMFPGTLWCGLGSRAVGYEELGMFESTDRCCREHDHCLHIIPAFTVNYGVFNSKFFTISLCDCDQRFRQCLLSVNDTISSMVGYSFFSILQVPCFELKQKRRCTQKLWSGMCKSVKKAPYAVFKSPLPYNSSDVTSNNNLTSAEEKHVTVSPVIDPNRKAPKSEHKQLLCGSLKHLDECRYKIPPLEKKYDLQNTESKTAYHCDCTSR
ncbi:group 3 secretory phospholipase A2-like [Pempheris klunzingeri]|uniref:group 3 secretory phospholipase A2-like n=1 Tax=Pempheris klunzingeri TaxID=3127111 RepID=UPI00397FBD26